MASLSTSIASALLKRCGTLSRTSLLSSVPSAMPRMCLSTSNSFLQSTTPVDINQTLQKMVGSNKVVVFMKGVPEEPKCGFSNAVVQILRMHGVNNYDSHNVLADEGVRQGIKDFSNWPTIPQVYVNGEFVGGCDILIQMHQNGELIELLQKVGIKSALAESEQSGDSQK